MNRNSLSYGLAGGVLALSAFLIWNGQDDGGTDVNAAPGHQVGRVTESPKNPPSSDRLPLKTGRQPAEVTPQSIDQAVSSDFKGSLKKQMARHRGNPSASSPHSSRSFSFSLKKLLNELGLTARQRVAGLERLRQAGSLTPEDRTAALEALQNTVIPEGVTPAEWHWIVDELITTLRVDGADNAALSEALAGVASNNEQDPIVRDYALQHLGHLSNEGGDLQVIDTALNSALTEKGNTLAGTALLALNHYTDDSALGQNALAIAGDSDYDLRSRLTAMQVAGKQENLDALPLAVNVASDASQPVVLRMTAIATIGDLKAVEHRPLLESFSRYREGRLYAAAQAALQKLTK